MLHFLVLLTQFSYKSCFILRAGLECVFLIRCAFKAVKSCFILRVDLEHVFLTRYAFEVVMRWVFDFKTRIYILLFVCICI